MLSRENALTPYLSLWNSRDASASRHCAGIVNADLWRFAQHDRILEGSVVPTRQRSRSLTGAVSRSLAGGIRDGNSTGLDGD